MYIIRVTDFRRSAFFRIAHRGASAYEPENTLRSFEKAIQLETDFIEFDVRSTLDGRVVVIHDPRVDRTTNGRGRVAHKTFSELRNLDAGLGEKVPSIEEVLELSKNRTGFVIELKEDGIEHKVLNAVKDFSIADEVFIVSFKARRLKLIKELEPQLKTGLIVFASHNPLRSALYCGADALAPFKWFVSRKIVEQAHHHGLYLFTWTVDVADNARRFREIGVNGIVTNKPDLI